MSEESGIFPTARSWRDIPQEVTTRAMSKSGRRRHLMAVAKVVAGVLFGGGVAWGAVALVSAIEYHPHTIARADGAGPVRATPEFKTDGVLTAAWAMKALALPKSATLMELDLGQLQDRLLASGQVRMAMLVKRYPDTLAITLTERVPVARIMVQDGSEPAHPCFVARDGVVFTGEGYDDQFSASLPWLDGVKLVRTNGRIAPIEGMDVVTDLITKAKYESEHLYSLFRVISLARFHSDGLIEVRSPVCENVVFTTQADFFRQLAYFDYICDTMKPSAESPLANIDLSLGPNVPVAFRDLVPAVDKSTAPAKQTVRRQRADTFGGRVTIPAFPNFQRKSTQREL